MIREQAIEKIVEALRAAEMRQGCTDYHFYAEKLYQDLFPKPSANREAVGKLTWILAEIYQKGKDHSTVNYADYSKQILALRPKVLSDELARLGLFIKEHGFNNKDVDELISGKMPLAVSQATVDKEVINEG